MINCGCGCGEEFPELDNRQRPRRFKHGHVLKQIGKNHPNWGGGKIIDRKGYVLIYRPNHPNAHPDGYVLEHRLVMEKHIGRYLIANVDDVHHINGNKQDNRIENLELVDHAKHTSNHRRGLV